MYVPYFSDNIYDAGPPTFLPACLYYFSNLIVVYCRAMLISICNQPQKYNMQTFTALYYQ